MRGIEVSSKSFLGVASRSRIQSCAKPTNQRCGAPTSKRAGYCGGLVGGRVFLLPLSTASKPS